MIIRTMKPEDYEPVIAIWESAGLLIEREGRESRDSIIKQLSLAEGLMLVAEDDGKPVGVVIGSHDNRKGWINRLAVSPEKQHAGVATALVKAVEAKFKSIGMNVIGLLMIDDNEKSAALFKSLGYVRHEDIVYYSKREDTRELCC
ncbi:MAG TPA: GNAT family N-acetyltransferase [bacterium]|nr:GNAT family N-acetyltransferase [bacterium]